MKSKFWSPILVFIAAMLWATDAPFRVNVIEKFSSVFIVLIEHFFSFIILLPFFIKALPKLKKLDKKSWLSLIVISVGSSALALIMFTESFKLMNPSASIILQKLQPFIVIIIAHFVLKERLGIKFWPFAIIAIFGAYIISFPNLKPILFIGETWNPHFLGVLFALGSAILWGLGTILGRVSLKNLDWKEVTASRFFIGFIFLMIWNILNGDINYINEISGKSILYLFIMSVVSGAVGLLIYYRGLRDTKASIATIAELGFVIMSVLVNYLFIGDKLTMIQIIGMIIVLFSVLGLAKKNQT